MGAQAYDQRARQREIANLKKRAQKLGLSIVETENHAALAGYSQKHAWIYQAIVDMSQKGVPADVVTLCDELERRRQLEEVGGSAFVMDLVKAVPTSIHARHYARIVEFHAIARNLLRGAGQIAQPILFRSVVDLLGFPSGSW